MQAPATQLPECSGDFMKPLISLVSVVDDDESVRESLPDLIRAFGFDVEAFSSAEAFLASDSVGETRCLILDVGHARHDGTRTATGAGAPRSVDSDHFHHRAQGRHRPAPPARTRRGRVPVQAVQRCGPAEGAELRTSNGLIIALLCPPSGR